MQNGWKNMSFWTQIYLMLWKNLKISQRHKLRTCCELLIPFIFGLVITGVRLGFRNQSGDSITEFPKYDLSRFPENISENLSGGVNVRQMMLNYQNAVKHMKEIPEFVIDFIKKLTSKQFHAFLPKTKNALNSMIALLPAKPKTVEIGYSPVSNLTDRTMNEMEKLLKPALKVKGFSSEAELFAWIEKTDIGVFSVKFGGIVFSPDTEGTDKFSDNLTIKIVPRASNLLEKLLERDKDWRTDSDFLFRHMVGPRNTKSTKDYYDSGFLTVQHTLSAAIYKVQTGEKFPAATSVLRMPYTSYQHDNVLIVLGEWLSRMLFMCFMFPVVNLVKDLLHEREQQITEYMKMMGLSGWINWTAWMARSMILFLIISVIIVIFLKFTGSLLIFSSSSLLLVFFVLYSFSVTSFGFMCSTFFNKASTGAMWSGVLFFFTFIPYHLSVENKIRIGVLKSILTGLFNNSTLGMAVRIIITQEGNGVGCQWWNLTRHDNIDTAFSLAHVFLMLLVNSLIYLLIAFYVRSVFPGKHGLALPWHFPITCFWRRAGVEYRETSQLNTHQGSNLFEDEPTGLMAGVRICNLSKMYRNGKVAVKSLSLNLYRNQITALLGHNGAGKTTTISMLVGLFSPTSGTAYIDGFDITTDINNVRKSLGICPQHNVLFDELTVSEHIRFFCTLKGFVGDLQLEVQKMLDLLNLRDQQNTQSIHLSGGMKRKLSVGIALCGGSRVVLLDEPTGAMDPSARRATWNLLKRERRSRTLLLTTHSMEEADVLADRIMIMANGKLQCGGSSLFLKHKLGSDYYLNIVKVPECNVEEVTDFIQQYLPRTSLHRHVAGELTYTLPLSSAHVFQTVFTELEKKQSQLGISSFGGSETTMEEVFIKAISKSNTENGADRNGNNREVDGSSRPLCSGKQYPAYTNTEYSSTSTIAIGNSTNTLYPTAHVNRGFRLNLQQLRAMLVKRWLFSRGHWLLLLTQVFFPAVFTLITWLMLTSRIQSLSSSELKISLQNLPESVQTVWMSDWQQKLISPIQQAASTRVEFLTPSNGSASSLKQYLLQKQKKDLARFNQKRISAINFDKNFKSATVLYNGQSLHSAAYALHEYDALILHWMKKKPIRSYNIYNEPYQTNSSKVLGRIGSNSKESILILMISSAITIVSASFIFFVVKEHAVGFGHLQKVCGNSQLMFYLGHFLFDFTIATLSNSLVLLILRTVQTENLQQTDLQVAIFVILSLQSFCSIMIAYLTAPAFLVPSAGFVFLLSVYYILGIGGMMVLHVMSELDLLSMGCQEVLHQIFFLIPSFNMASSMGHVFVNFLPKKHCNLYPELRKACGVLDMKEIFSVPNVCCPGERHCWKNGCFTFTESLYSLQGSGLGVPIIVLLTEGFLFALLILIQRSNYFTRVQQFFYRKMQVYHTLLEKRDRNSNQDLVTLDEDVGLETQTVYNIIETEDNLSRHLLLIRNLTKFYSESKLAVDRVCLNLKKGECFGLLGVNGAGKTTTFKMITGFEPASYGEIIFNGSKINSRCNDFYRNVGYCPQYDSLLGQLTCREILRIFARLRGIVETRVDATILDLANQLNFVEHLDKKIGGNSGGNRRKVSTAVALIGEPQLIFLDEPTTGMDPVARRLLWDVISRTVARGQSVILTSHSMEECEALCTRLAIMVNGRFKCLGSPQHLKNKFGSGYTLIIKLTSRINPSPPRNNRRSLSHVLHNTPLNFNKQSRRTLSEGVVPASHSPHHRPNHPYTLNNSSSNNLHPYQMDSDHSPAIETDLQLEKQTSVALKSINKDAVCVSTPENTKLHRYIQASFPGAILVNGHHAMLSYRLPNAQLTWANLFGVMERAKVEFSIEYYSLSQTTLEQVFLNFANKHELSQQL